MSEELNYLLELQRMIEELHEQVDEMVDCLVLADYNKEEERV